MELTLKCGQVGVLELCGGLILVSELGILDIGVHLLDLGLEVLDLINTALLTFPAGLLLLELILEVCKLLAELFKTLHRETVGLLLKRHFLDLELHYLAADIVKLCGHGVYLRADERTCLIDKVNCLIRQETVGYIAVGKRCGGDKGVIVDANTVVHLVALLEATENGYRVLDRRLIDHDRLEPTLKSCVLFDILAVLVERCRTDAVQLASCKHRLEQVACVHAALGLAGADYGVQLIDKEDYLALGLLDLLQNGLQTLLKFAAVLCTGYQCAHIQREYRLILKSFGDIATHDTLGKPLGDGGLADTGFAYENRVVLRLSRQDADDIPYLVITADDRVKLLLSCTLDKVGAVLFKCVIGILGVIARNGAVLDLGKLGGKSRLRDAVVCQNALHCRCCGGKNTYHQMLDGKVLVAEALCRFLGCLHHPVGLTGQVHIRVARDLGQRRNCGVELCKHGVAVNAHLAQQ